MPGNIRIKLASFFLVAAVAVALVSGAGWAASPPKVTVAIGTWIGFGKVIIAKEKGYFDGIDVDVRIIDDGNALIGGITGGTLDIAQNSLDQFALHRANGLPAKLLLVTDESSGGDGAVVAPEITSGSELRGKAVAYTPGPASEYLLATALTGYGLRISDVKSVTFDDPSGTLTSFVSGKVDAAVTWQPFLDQALERKGARLLFTSKDYPRTVLGVMLVRENLKDRAEISRKFIAGWRRAEIFLSENPKEASQIIARGLSLQESDIEAMSGGAKLQTGADNLSLLTEKGENQAPIVTLLQNASAYWNSRGVANAYKFGAGDVEAASISAFEK